MKTKPHRFFFVVGLTALVGLAAAGCAVDAGSLEGDEMLEGGEVVDTSDEALTSRCFWITVQTGMKCDFDPPTDPGGPPIPTGCEPEYGQIQVCQDPMQYCTNYCGYCRTSCVSGPGYPTCVNVCMNHCMGGCLAANR
jgi:hypothetical protein